MTQDEKWLVRYNEVKSFIEANHRNPSKYDPEERSLVNWTKQQRKLVNAGGLHEPRQGLFNRLLELSSKYRRKNQYQ